MYKPMLLVLAASLVIGAAPMTKDQGNGSIKAMFAGADHKMIVVAHRGCHNPAPDHGFGAAPENSLLALERCIAMGVDMMETDIQRSADGHLIMMHDETVDRTTEGHGRISDMTLAQLRKLHLRQNLGGYDEPLTDQTVLTLEEILAAAKGRITLNLDVKAAIYVEVVDAVVRAGAQDRVTVKTLAGIASPPLASLQPYDKVPFIPILEAPDDPGQLPAIVERQATGAHPVALELPKMPGVDLPPVVEAARRFGLPLFANTIGDGFIGGMGGDNDALRNPDVILGGLYRAGIRVFQTDRPELLLKYRATTLR